MRLAILSGCGRLLLVEFEESVYLHPQVSLPGLVGILSQGYLDLLGIRGAG